MALPAKPVLDIARMNAEQRFAYFLEYARHIPDAPEGRGYSYAIRIGGEMLFSDDTAELREQFDRLTRRLRRKYVKVKAKK